ncbi:MAG TPA: tetratricopeptide repeat protein, partial [Planctomycetes bacterium]|nr:tetratricopeptide repeat protein [Planctomycetota bacterium]
MKSMLRVLFLLCVPIALLSARPASVEGTVGAVAAVDPATPFELGVRAYRAGRYREAEAHWRELLARPLSRVERARVAFDLGNAAYRQERPLDAIGWYTVALSLEPRHRAARHNLERARAQAGLDPADRGDLSSTLRRVLTAWTVEEAREILLAALALFGLALFGEALRGGAGWRRAAWATFVLA